MTEKEATIAFILDRAEQLPNSSAARAMVDELVAGIAEGRHIDCAAAGEYDDLEERVNRIIDSHADVRPLVRRPSLRSVR